MNVVVQERDTLDLYALWRVAVAGEGLRIGRRARTRMAAAHRAFQDFVREDSRRYIYGLTTGYGPSAAKRQSPDESVARRRKGGIPFLGLSFGDGRLPEAVTRAMVFATVARHLDGHSALHPDRVARVAAMLDGTPAAGAGARTDRAGRDSPDVRPSGRAGGGAGRRVPASPCERRRVRRGARGLAGHLRRAPRRTH